MKSDRNYRDWVLYGNIATLMGSSVIVGAVIGYYLDRWLHTGPWMSLIWTVIGVAAGFRALFRGLQELDRREQQRRKSRK